MSRLYDRLFRYDVSTYRMDPKKKVVAEAHLNDLGKLPFFVVDSTNVAYYMVHIEREISFPLESPATERAFPNSAPAWKHAFIEARNPGIRFESEDGHSQPLRGWGVTLSRLDHKAASPKNWEEESRAFTLEEWANFEDIQFREKVDTGLPIPPRWELIGGCYAEYIGINKPQLVGGFRLGVLDNGQICRWGDRTPVAGVSGYASDPQIENEAAHFVFAVMPFVLKTLSFVHCKNVEVLAQDPLPKASRKHKRKFGRPLTRYHTLMIDPMAGKAKSSAKGVKKDLMPLHICRGNFAHYEPERPLFGKYSGTFWRPQHVKGSRKNGEVHKDYRVKAPA